MKRIYPARVQDKFHLSKLLNQLLQVLETCPLQVRLKALCYDAQIPENIILRLQNLHNAPDDAVNITARDYHIVFANILFRYPTVQMFELPDGSVFFKM